MHFDSFSAVFSFFPYQTILQEIVVEPINDKVSTCELFSNKK